MYKTHANKNVVSDFIRKSHPNKYKKMSLTSYSLKFECVQKENKYYKIFKKNCMLITKKRRKTYRSHSEGIPIPFRRKREDERRNV